METIIKVHPEAIKCYAERSWTFSYQTIWYKCLLNDDEICEIKNQLQELYRSILADNFKEKAERYLQQFSKQIEDLSKRKYLSRELLLASFKKIMQEIGNPPPEKQVYFNRKNSSQLCCGVAVGFVLLCKFVM
jgi:hypothetical protein